jgi:hypothetical protein
VAIQSVSDHRKRRNLDALPTRDVDARSVCGAEARRMGLISDSHDRKPGTGSVSLRNEDYRGAEAFMLSVPDHDLIVA